MIDLIGFFGATMFALCAAPQAAQCVKQGHAKGINHIFLSMWFMGEVAMLAYTLLAIGVNWPLILNYFLNLVFISVIVYYKMISRSKGVNQWNIY